MFGAVVRFCRERAGLSRPELAGRIHKSVSLIESIERGDRVATGDVTADLEDVADLNTDGILTMLRHKSGSSLNYNALPVWFEDWAEALPRAASLALLEEAATTWSQAV